MSKEQQLLWVVEQRLEFIEFRLFWEGGLRRTDITGFFGISLPQASNDFGLYQKLAPENIRYSMSEKRYVATDLFKPRYLKPDANRYLEQITSAVTSSFSGGHGWVANPPGVGVLPIPHRQVDAFILRKILMTIRAMASVRIFYQSMNDKRPGPVWRWITPHAFGSDGTRWHVRAFCHIDNRFKDFILSRTLQVQEQGEPGRPGAQDYQWNNYFGVCLAPNPALRENQQQVVAQDYAMQDGQARIEVRRALLYYFYKRLRLDVAENPDDPREVPVIVKNLPELRDAIAAARQ